MHSHFPRWYAVADLTNDEGVLESRWTAVAALAKAATWSDVDSLVRISFRLRPAKPDGTQRIRSLLVQADATIDRAGNDRELEILCATALVALFDLPTATGRGAALAVATATLGGTRKSVTPIDLAGEADAALNKFAELARTRENDHLVPDAPKIDLSTAAAKAKEGSNFENVAAAFGTTADLITAALKGFAKKTQATLDGVVSQLRMQDEELDMLWWLVGSRSWALKCAFADVPADAAPLVFAAELASLTKLLPGPSSIASLLARAGIGDADLAVADATNASPLAWLESITDGGVISPILHPLHHAADRRVETGDQSAWIAGWAASSDVSASAKLPAIVLAQQFFRERLQLLLVKE